MSTSNELLEPECKAKEANGRHRTRLGWATFGPRQKTVHKLRILTHITGERPWKCNREMKKAFWERLNGALVILPEPVALSLWDSKHESKDFTWRPNRMFESKEPSLVLFNMLMHTWSSRTHIKWWPFCNLNQGQPGWGWRNRWRWSEGVCHTCLC